MQGFGVAPALIPELRSAGPRVTERLGARQHALPEGIFDERRMPAVLHAERAQPLGGERKRDATRGIVSPSLDDLASERPSQFVAELLGVDDCADPQHPV